MFSTLYNFFCEIRQRAIDNQRLTLVQCRNAQFSNMTRAHLLNTRASCYDLAEQITAYVCEQDTRDNEQD